jgi:aminopeptidase N
MSDAPEPVLLADYTVPSHLVESIELDFDLREEAARIESRARYRRNPAAPDAVDRLSLDGVFEELEEIALSGEVLDLAALPRTRTGVEIPLPEGLETFDLRVRTKTDPKANQSLMGLYRSGSTYCTQCEAEGFRKITFFPDRPDVMTRYRTRIEADRAAFPILLSNGNRIESGDLEEGRHFAVWEDPFPKPSYLFAMVAGDLGLIEDRFETQSGREVKLEVYVDRGDEDRAGHAMASLKRSMAWDERVYGREYDLDLFMIVAVHDFNFGAMENKGLNIFNSALVLARPDTATDSDYQRIEGVVAHEYFHNWSGNRVTCRDWFQLSLKEGFTVFRDQCYSADQGSADVQRVGDVRYLRAAQFAEDASPMAHPVRPESYLTIDNFYTVTIYEKGAELIRMIYRILGPEAFRAGSDLYFERHDGQAVTTDDFVAAMEDASGEDLGQFRRWYEQAGTPVVTAQGNWEIGKRRYSLTLKQRTPATPGQSDKKPLHIPIAIALLDRKGQEMPLHLAGDAADARAENERILHLREAEETFVFENLREAPRPSLLRGFSAPVKLEVDLDDEDLAFLFAHDKDGFNRWEAGQRLALRTLLRLVEEWGGDEEPAAPELLIDAMGAVLSDEDLDPALAAEALVLPTESWIGDQMEVVEPQAIHAARCFLRAEIARAHLPRLVELHAELAEDPNEEIRFDAEAMGRRALRNVILGYLVALDTPEFSELAYGRFRSARTMTDEIAALALLADGHSIHRPRALSAFAERWQKDQLVMNKWLVVQAMASRDSVLDEVRALSEGPHFDGRNPNKVRSLYGAFARNLSQFHAPGGKAYAFLADRIIEIDGGNPQLAAGLAGLLKDWRRFGLERGAAMRAQLERIRDREGLSRNTFEIVSKSLETA